jgi:hypothetical protein
MPALVGKLTPLKRSLEFEGNCFERVTMDMSYAEGSDILHITVRTEKPRNLTCSDSFMFGNTEIAHVEEIFFRGTHHL